MINIEQQRRNNYTKSEHHSIMLYITMALGSVSIILVLIIYKCKFSKKTTMLPMMYPMQPVPLAQGITTAITTLIIVLLTKVVIIVKT